MKLGFYSKNFEKYSNIKFNESRPSGSRVVPCSKADRQRNMIKLIVALRKFVEAPKNQLIT